MRCLVTGAAGFIGSHLCEQLLARGHEVVGLDAFVPYYDRRIKEGNLRSVRCHPRFTLHEADLRSEPLEELVADVEAVFHLAAMPGLMASWTDLEGYWGCNVLGTHRLLEAIRRRGRLRRFVHASTSSVYGKYASGDESLPLHPISPYGVTKLAAEHLCRAHADAFGLPVVVLRFFSVYGPRQRPDMAYHRFITALLQGEPITIYGDGMQVRGNTYVEDCVEATIAALDALPGETFNVGGGEAATVWDIVRKLETLAGRRAEVRLEPPRPGDQRYTFADTARLRRHLGWTPKTSLDEGLARQWEWQKGQLHQQAAVAREAA
jgi:nucleoside-diphosphate-sugar epimerase